MPLDSIASTSDEELAASCKRNHVEEWLHRSGCLLGLVCGFVAGAAVISLNIVGVTSWSWFWSSYLAFMTFFWTAPSIYGLLRSLSRFRCRHFLRELEYRYGERPLSEYVKAATQSITSAEIVLILMGRTLPLCHKWWVFVRIDGGKAGTVETRFGPIDARFDFGAGISPKDSFKFAQGNLDAEQSCRLAELATKIHKRKTNVSSTVKDGFPIDFALISGDTKQAKFVSCNLAGIPETWKRRPHVFLVKEVFTAGRDLIDSPSWFGSCNARTGEIQIGEI